jgi:hypothetical protein
LVNETSLPILPTTELYTNLVPNGL